MDYPLSRTVTVTDRDQVGEDAVEMEIVSFDGNTLECRLVDHNMPLAMRETGSLEANFGWVGELTGDANHPRVTDQISNLLATVAQVSQIGGRTSLTLNLDRLDITHGLNYNHEDDAIVWETRMMPGRANYGELRYSQATGHVLVDIDRLVSTGVSLRGGHDRARTSRVVLKTNTRTVERVQSMLEKVTLESTGSMGMFLFSVGAKARKPVFCGRNKIGENSIRRTYKTTASELKKHLHLLENWDIALSDSQKDALAMDVLETVDDERLHSDQKRAVAVHLTTQRGFVNAMATGDGKTISTLVALNHLYYRHDDDNGPFSALVVLEAGVRKQWEEEASRWLDDSFQTVCVTSRKDSDKLAAALKNDRPTLVLCSYTLAADALEAESDLGKLLADTRFEDVVLDEGRTVRGNNKTARALWAIRENARRGTVLCATPVLKSVKDLAKLMAWARKDRTIASAAVEKTFHNMTTREQFSDWYAWWGDTLVRSSGKHTQAQQKAFKTPDIATTIVDITPNEREIELSQALGGRIRKSLENVLETYTKMGGTLSRDEERKLRGSLLATSSIARQAASDARMIQHSTSDLAVLLQEDGVVAFDDDFVPAKFDYCVKDCIKKTTGRNKGQVVVFTEFKHTAKALKKALEDKGVNTALFLGQNIKQRDLELKEFKDGKRQVLIATSAAERGLNLQTARYLIHYDHKFTPDSIFQRTGRVTRINSTHDTVDVSFYVTTATIDERVFAVSVARSGLAGATATQTVEDFAASSRGKMLKTLSGHAAKTSLKHGKETSLLELTQALVG